VPSPENLQLKNAEEKITVSQAYFFLNPMQKNITPIAIM
jgi:hypothetical protein